jgi:hypothetical protein
MFRTLLAHPQKALHKRKLVYYVRVMSVGRTRIGVFCVAPPENEQVMLETFRGHYFVINWIKFASRWFYSTDLEFTLFVIVTQIFYETES